MSRNFTNYAIAGSDRAGMPKVNRDHLFRYSTWIPSLSEQINIAQKIDEIASETNASKPSTTKKSPHSKNSNNLSCKKPFTGELTTDTANEVRKPLRKKLAA
jgi:type I restriction enzyme S subunit